MPDAVALPSESRARPRRKAAAPAPAPSRLRGATRFVTARPGRTLAVLGATALLVGVVVNALFLQRGPHPAPLFAPAPPLAQVVRPTAVVQAPAPALLPTPVPRPSDLRAKPEPAPAPQQAAAAPAPAAEAAAPFAPLQERRSDRIGDLLRGDPVSTIKPASAEGGRVAAAQRALEKLGYQVAVDGVFGAGTRAAVQRYERERNLPVTGDLNARTLRDLAERSGVAIP